MAIIKLMKQDPVSSLILFRLLITVFFFTIYNATSAETIQVIVNELSSYAILYL